MQTRTKPLTATFCRAIKAPGTYSYGGGGSHGLYLRVWVQANGRIGKAWGQRLGINRRATNLGFSPYPVVTPTEVRAKALEYRRTIAQGCDCRISRK